MAENENTQVVKDAYAAFKRGDIEAVVNAGTDDVDWFVPGPPDVIKPAGQRRGRAEVAEFFKTLDENQVPLVFEPQTFITEGDKVAVQGVYTWTVKSTGGSFTSDWCHVFTIRGGKIAGFKEYFDTASGVEAYRPS
jgi:ketosteroid isomerase-like protein